MVIGTECDKITTSIHSNIGHWNQVQRNQLQDLLCSHLFSQPTENLIDNFSQFLRQQRRNGIANLMVLLGAPALKKIVVREGLNARRFTHCSSNDRPNPDEKSVPTLWPNLLHREAGNGSDHELIKQGYRKNQVTMGWTEDHSLVDQLCPDRS